MCFLSIILCLCITQASKVSDTSTGRQGPHIALFDYQTTRARKHPQKFLQGFKGYLCTDAYQSYDGLPDVINVCCLAHARRKWDEALKSLPKEVKEKPCAAKEGLDFCNRLYRVEHELEDVSPKERYEGRLEKSKPILDEFYKWLKYQRPRITPKSTTGKAITYCLNQWSVELPESCRLNDKSLPQKEQ